ncbi:ABC transporter ATP-binding protein [bacterium]|nr:ABC transporter ATP-binding protein [bacterium]
MPIIEVKELTKSYFNLIALNKIGFTIAQGEAVGLIGSNGAGKTTLMHILIGFLGYDEGEAFLLGKRCSEMDISTKQKVGFVPEEHGLLPWANLLELASLYRNLYPEWNQDLIEQFIDEWGLQPEKRLRTLSKGQKRLTELALCFSCQPRVLLLDEPFIGLDAVMRLKVFGILNELNQKQGTTIFYSSHILPDVERIARRIIIIKEGISLLDSSIRDLHEPLESLFAKLYDLKSETGDPTTIPNG